MVPRSQSRSGFNDGVRLQLVETDIDTLEKAVAEQNSKLSKILWANIGLLISVATSGLLLAVNLMVAR